MAPETCLEVVQKIEVWNKGEKKNKGLSKKGRGETLGTLALGPFIQVSAPGSGSAESLIIGAVWLFFSLFFFNSDSTMHTHLQKSH